MASNFSLHDLREDVKRIDDQIYRAINMCNILAERKAANMDDVKRMLKKLGRDTDGILTVIQLKRTNDR